VRNMAAQPAHTQNTFNNKGNVANQAARRGLYGPYTIKSVSLYTVSSKFC